MIRELDYLEHMLECIALIEKYAAMYEDPLAIDIIRDGILHNLQIIAQSALRLPDELQQRHPEVNWHGLRAFRNILVHDYRDVSLSRVNTSIKQALPVLKQMARTELTSLTDDST